MPYARQQNNKILLNSFLITTDVCFSFRTQDVLSFKVQYMQNGFGEFQILWNCLSLQYSALSFPQAQLALSSVRLLNWIQRKFRSCLAPKGKVGLWCTDVQTVKCSKWSQCSKLSQCSKGQIFNMIAIFQNAHDTTIYKG